MVIEYQRAHGHCEDMKHILPICGLLAAMALPSAGSAADCYADYKAKQNNPLKLHYGVIQIRGACNKAAAQGEIQSRLAASGWTLLNVMAIFGPEGLQQRKANAGSYFLRF